MSPLAQFKLLLRRALPREIFDPIFSVYHFALAICGAVVYGFPSRQLVVIGVTGTKGKSSTVEMIAAIFEKHGWKTAVLNSIRIKVGDGSRANIMRMSMPGRFFIQRFFAQARAAGCRVAVIEMTSQGTAQHRHRGIDLDALVFTNLAPEHIESHGSFEAYADAKYEIGLQLARSIKRPRVIVANADDPAGGRFLTLPVEHALPFSLSNTEHTSSEQGGRFRFDDTDITVALPGEFSLQNALAAATVARAFGIKAPTIAAALGGLSHIPGRAERIEEGQEFAVVVDYAHTIESQQAIYEAFGSRRKICVLGSCGGGRDVWVRPKKGAVAEKYCEYVILTNEDPYDEDPHSIVEGIRRGMKEKQPTIIMDRRAAIAHALSLAHEGDAVIITGKGTDPTIEGPRGTSTPWSDAQVAREELQKMQANPEATLPPFEQ